MSEMDNTNGSPLDTRSESYRQLDALTDAICADPKIWTAVLYGSPSEVDEAIGKVAPERLIGLKPGDFHALLKGGAIDLAVEAALTEKPLSPLVRILLEKNGYKFPKPDRPPDPA